MRWSILLVCAVLAACATQPAAPLRPDQLFNDAAFQTRSAPVDTDVFALSDVKSHRSCAARVTSRA